MRGVKWTAETAALKAVVEKFAADADPQLSVGLDFFADGAAGDRTVEEPLGPMDDSKSARIRALIDKMEPTTDTPTFGALSLAYRTLDGYQPTGALKDGTKVVVLMTDGKPTPDTAHALSGRSEADWIHGIVEEAHRKGVLTFAVGVGDFPPNPDYDPKFLGKTAVVGGTQRSPQCNPSEIRDPSNLCYFQVTPPKSGAPTKAEVDRLTQDFVDTLQTIRGQLGACEYKLEFAPGASVDFSKVNVVFRDESNQEETFPKDSVNGWSYDNEAAPTSVRLAGAACDRVRNTTGKVTIVLGCSSIGIR
jgi:hypothetical protein